jgi:DNA replication protein DnaC
LTDESAPKTSKTTQISFEIGCTLLVPGKYGTGKKLIMAAVTTDICMVFQPSVPCKRVFDLLAILDASGSGFDVQEDLARRRMATAGVVLTTTNTAVAELVQDWSTPQGLELVPLIMASEPNTPGYVGK